MNGPGIMSSNRSWHYKLVLYVFGPDFFLEVDGIDIKAMDVLDMEKDFRIIYKKKPRTVNLCPYCRAVVGATILFPFTVLWRLFPHEEKKYSHKENMKRIDRNSKIARIVACSFFVGLAIWHLSTESYYFVAFNLALAVFNIASVNIFRWLALRLPKKKYKLETFRESKESSKIIKKISEKHDLICPPIFFLDTTENKDIV